MTFLARFRVIAIPIATLLAMVSYATAVQGFTRECDNCFMNVTSRRVTLEVRSTEGVKARSLNRGDILSTFGNSRLVLLRFSSGRTLRYDESDLKALMKQSGVGASRGGWLIASQGLLYVSKSRYLANDRKLHPEWF